MVSEDDAALTDDKKKEESTTPGAEKAGEGDSPSKEEAKPERPAQEDAEEEEQYFRARTPNVKNKEMFGIADQLVGGSRIKVNCEDGRARLGRIPGKMKRRMWIRTGDLLIVKPWDIQDDKCDIKYRYMRNQSVALSKRGMLPETIDIF